MTDTKRELLFVYNADGGLWNGLLDLAHKTVSPSTYQCSLCALTYRGTRMTAEWAEFVNSLPHDVRFLHRDEFARETAQVLPPLPALFEHRDATFATLIGKSELDRCKNLGDLIALVRSILGPT